MRFVSMFIRFAYATLSTYTNTNNNLYYFFSFSQLGLLFHLFNHSFPICAFYLLPFNTFCHFTASFLYYINSNSDLFKETQTQLYGRKYIIEMIEKEKMKKKIMKSHQLLLLPLSPLNNQVTQPTHPGAEQPTCQACSCCRGQEPFTPRPGVGEKASSIPQMILALDVNFAYHALFCR